MEFEMSSKRFAQKTKKFEIRGFFKNTVMVICRSPSGAEALTFRAFYGTAGSRAPSKLVFETRPKTRPSSNTEADWDSNRVELSHFSR
jgi:hypothetical protein